MAAFPFTTFKEGSVAVSVDGRELVRATNGTLKTRLLYSGDKKQFSLLRRLTSAEKTTLDSFYGTNRAISWTLVFDGGTSTCVFAKPPQYTPLPGSLYEMTVQAEEL